MPGLRRAIFGALFLAFLNTLGDFIWARWIPAHRAVFGVLHGALLCSGLGLYLGSLERRPFAGAAGGVGVGVLAAGSFYVLAPLLGMAAMLPAWMLLWVLFSLQWRWLGAHAGYRGALARGAVAALGAGAGFYAISGIWIHPPPGGPNYPYNFLCWTVAFLPGFLALLLRRP